MTVRVQLDDFDIGAEIAAMTGGRQDIGALVTFTGLVRGSDAAETDTAENDAAENDAAGIMADRALKSMTLEHYPGMTEAELTRVEAQAHERWPLQASLIIHRFGELKPGDNIVLVVTASKHRLAAFEAAEYLMDYLKTQAPFWKKETAMDGSGEWVDARQADDVALSRWAK